MTSTITGIVKKHVYTSNGFDVFSIKPLLNDAIEPAEIDPKWKTLTISGSEISYLKENRIYTMNIELSTKNTKYKGTYTPLLITKSYPNVVEEQLEFLREVVTYFKKDDTNAMNVYKEFIKKPELMKSEDLVVEFKELLDQKRATKDVYNAIKNLQPFSPIVQYLSEKGIIFEDALALANAESVSIKVFQKYEDNIFQLYYKSRSLPMTSLIRVQQILNPNADFTSKNVFFLDSAIRYFVERNLYQNNLGYTTLDELSEQLDDVFKNESNWEETLNDYTPNSRSRIKVFNTEENRIFVNKFVYNNTKLLNEMLTESINKPIDSKLPNLQSMKDKYNLDFEPSDEQKRFIELAYKNRITLLTGPGGSGKSGAVAALTSVLKRDNKKFKLLAPTAKAAQVLAEYTGEDAHTLHSWIAQNENSDSAIETEFLIIDEMSMTDEELAAKMLRIIQSNDLVHKHLVHVIWSGDVAQLLPVSYGAPFKDSLDLYPEVSVRLTQIYRQKNPEIIDVLTSARNGKFQVNNIYDADKYVKVTSKVAYHKYTTAEQVSKLIKFNMSEYSPEEYSNYGVISPLNAEVTKLNLELQAKLNQNAGASFVTRSILNGQFEKFALNDPIILTKNTLYLNADKIANKNGHEALTPQDVQKFENKYLTTRGTLAVPDSVVVHHYNGDSGYVSEILTPNSFIVTLTSGQKEKRILMHTKHISISNVDLAYALTVHKAQGSQYKHVIFVNVRSRAEMSSKNLVYTALSRAKEDVVIFSNSTFSNISEKRRTFWPTFKETTDYTKTRE